jgi:hypothetical protein
MSIQVARSRLRSTLKGNRQSKCNQGADGGGGGGGGGGGEEHQQPQ